MRKIGFLIVLLLSSCIACNSGKSNSEPKRIKIAKRLPQKDLRAFEQAFYIYNKCSAIWVNLERLQNLESDDLIREIDLCSSRIDSLSAFCYADDSLQNYQDRFLELMLVRIQKLKLAAEEKRIITSEEVNDSLTNIVCGDMLRYTIHKYGPKGKSLMSILQDDSIYLTHPQRLNPLLQLNRGAKENPKEEYPRLQKLIANQQDSFLSAYATLRAGELLEAYNNELASEDITASEKMLATGLNTSFYHPYYYDTWLRWAAVYQRNWGGSSSTSRVCNLERNGMRHKIALKILDQIDRNPEDFFAQAQFFNLMFFNPVNPSWPYSKRIFEE
jgi:hypothetical protein